MNDNSPPIHRRFLAILGVFAAWCASTWLFWVGYVGADDLFYARYAYFLNRPPINWWEFRMLPNLAIRASFALFGPNEFAAVLPNLLMSLLLLAVAAWMIGWPGRLTWSNQMTMVLIPFIPWDAAFRSLPGAAYFAGILFCAGAGLFIGRFDGEVRARVRYLGAALLAGSFSSHEVMLFPVSLLVLAALYFDWRLYLKPVVVCGVVAAALVGVEAAVYWKLVGDPLVRFHTASAAISIVRPGFDPDANVSGWRFYTWPLELLTFAKPFAGSLIVLLVAGIICWKKLSTPQKILFCSTFATWIWFGWGSTKPFIYNPLSRLYHYYGPLVLGVGTLLPVTLFKLFERRPYWARLALCGFLAVFFLFSAAGGRWGQNVAVSRKLLAYAAAHPDRTFIADVRTMNEMYVLGGFSLPRNIFCIDGPAVQDHMLLNKQPANWPRFHFSPVEADGILINREGELSWTLEPEAASFRNQHPGKLETIAEPQTKPAFRPFKRFLASRSFFEQNAGAQVILLPVPVSTARP